MSFFKKLFGKSNNNETTVNEIKTPIKTKNEFSPLVLWWINNKKGGYDTAQKKFPSWFANKYSIDFDFEVSQYLKKGFLEYSNSTNVVLNEEGKKELKYYNCIVILHMHPEYKLLLSDFAYNSQWHIMNDNDIIWSIFNKRQLLYSQAKQWNDLMNNYLNMSSLLLDESKYIEALDLILPAVFIATSGMLNDNKLSPYKDNDGYLDVICLEINNYSMSNPIRKIIQQTGLDLDNIAEKFSTSEHISSLKTLLPFYYLDISEAWKMLECAIKANVEKGVYTLFDIKGLGIKLKYNIPNPNSKSYFYNSSENQIRAFNNKN